VGPHEPGFLPVSQVRLASLYCFRTVKLCLVIIYEFPAENVLEVAVNPKKEREPFEEGKKFVKAVVLDFVYVDITECFGMHQKEP